MADGTRTRQYSVRWTDGTSMQTVLAQELFGRKVSMDDRYTEVPG